MANPQLAEHRALRLWPELGDEFLGFELLEELGRGAFARVFLASELALSRRRVVAKIGSQGAGEAEIIAKLRHPYIVPIHSVRLDPGTGWSLICMPYQGRSTLCDVVDRIRSAGIPADAAQLRSIFQPLETIDPASAGTPLPATQSPTSYTDALLALGRKIAEALAYAHSQGVCHQDLKPSNVLLTFSGDPVLLDFNLSSDGRPADRVGGTLPYMAPEQIEAVQTWNSEPRMEFKPASDVFAWGVLMFELLCGRQPFRSVAVEDAQLWADLRKSRLDPVDFAPLTGRIAPAWIELLRGCLAFDLNERPSSARQLVDKLDRIAAHSASPPTRRPRRAKLMRLAVPAILGLGLAGGYAWFARAPSSVRQLEAAQVVYRQKQYDQAIEYLNRALDADGSLAEALVLRGRAHQALGRYNAAFSDYEAAHELTQDPRLQAAKGFCLAMQNNHHVAIRCYEQAIAGGYRTAEVQNDLGFSLIRVGKASQALESLGLAIALDPNLQAALVNRASAEFNIALATGNRLPLDALRDITRAIELGPPAGDIYFQAASICALAAETNPQYVATGLEFLRQAVLNGCPTRLVDENPLFADFRKNPSYREMSTLKPQPAALRQAERLISPF